MNKKKTSDPMGSLSKMSEKTPPTQVPLPAAAQQQDPKPATVIHWKSVAMGIPVGIMLVLIFLWAGGQVCEFDLFGFTVQFPCVSFSPNPAPKQDPLLGVALTGLKYMAGGWDPQNIDLTKSATDGVRVNEGYSLRFYDLQLSVPANLKGYTGQFEIYAKGEVIGRSQLLPLQPGVTTFQGIIPTNYKFPGKDDAWLYDASWETIDLALIVYNQGKPAGGAVTTVRMNNTGRAWFITPPYAHLVSIIYRVNDGPQKVLDLRTAPEVGFEAAPGDSFAIDEVWYKATDTIKKNSMQLEIYPSAGQYDSASSRTSSWITFESGNHDLLKGESLTWKLIASDRKWLVITLARDDSTVLDRYVLPLASGQSSGILLK
jgi:hypothetical protein